MHALPPNLNRDQHHVVIASAAIILSSGIAAVGELVRVIRPKFYKQNQPGNEAESRFSEFFPYIRGKFVRPHWIPPHPKNLQRFLLNTPDFYTNLQPNGILKSFTD